MDEELVQIALKKAQLQIKLSIAKHAESVLDKELELVEKELDTVQVKQSSFNLASDALLRCQIERQYKDDKKQGSASDGQRLFDKILGVNEAIDRAKQTAMANNRELEKKVAEFQQMTKGRNSPWIPEKQRLLEKLKQRQEMLNQVQLKINQLDAQTRERRELIDGHSRYPLKKFCVNLAQYHVKMNLLRRCLAKEYKINRELKAVYAQRDQSLSLRESESLQFEQLAMNRTRTEPNHQVNDQHRAKDKDRNHQQLELEAEAESVTVTEKNTSEQQTEQNQSLQNHLENHEVVLELDTEEADTNELEKSAGGDNGDHVSLSLDQNQAHQDHLDVDEDGQRTEDDDVLFDFMGGRTEPQGNNDGSQTQKDFNFNAFSFMNGTNEDKDGSQAIGISAFDFLNSDLGATAASGDAGNKDAFDFFGGMNGTGEENSRHSFNFDFFSGIGNAAEKDSTQGASPGGFNFDF